MSKYRITCKAVSSLIQVLARSEIDLVFDYEPHDTGVIDALHKLDNPLDRVQFILNTLYKEYQSKLKKVNITKIEEISFP